MSMTLHGFASKLLSDPLAMTAYELDPEGQLAAAGLEDITPQDVQEIIPLVTEYSSVGGFAENGVGYVGGELATPYGTFVAGSAYDLTGPVPAGHIGATTPDGDLGVGFGEDGIAAGGQLINGGDAYVVGGTLDPMTTSGHFGVVTPDGSFGVDVGPDGLDIGGNALFSRFNDLGDSLDSDALDLTGGASSVASLITTGTDLGATLLDGGLLDGGLPVDLGSLGAGQLPVQTPELPVDLPQLPDAGPLDPGQLPVEVPQLPVDDGPPAGLPQLPIDLPQLPIDLPQLPVELPVQLPELPAELPVSDLPVVETLSGGGVTDAVSDSPVGDLLSTPVDGLDVTDGLLPLDQHLSL